MWKFLMIFVIIVRINGFPSDIPQSAAVYTPFSELNDQVNNKIKQSILSKTISFSVPFPDSGRKYAVKEYESLDSKKETAYGRLHELVGLISNPQPVIDNTEEHEKYGNDGGKGRAIGTKVVAGFEAFSNLLNTAVDAPFVAAKEYGRKITTSLNTLGGKISGIAY